ncbi:hypothetical protein BIFANG_02374 [Bifidobacterium angulatum DSM 20098 = JCM 7096]|uniref:Uncharacterized protein n=1 Tax=Bifidobacterium angulatum DSM 20098 = JCM 7096 TaxID=518635 RepID=C4FDI9_9BIFI|nr:hypothetical protein BIFANG_02374 [Bifidobacterium angulatum DSM 20098 = JCM 7096]
MTVCLLDSLDEDDDEDELLEQPASVAHMASAHPAAKAERSSVVIFCECMIYHCSRKP